MRSCDGTTTACRERLRVERRASARERGSHQARLQYPHPDLSRCIGCGSCVAACPEEGVLEVIHGQAVVAHGARCVGHGLCAQECPVGAIAITLGDLEKRRDLPAIGHDFEVAGTPGLFLAGEVTGFALIGSERHPVGDRHPDRTEALLPGRDLTPRPAGNLRPRQLR